MTIDKVYTLFLFLANKASVGYFGPDAFNTLFDIAQNQTFNDYMSNLKGWKDMGPDARRVPGDIQPNTDSLSPFKVGPVSLSVTGSGDVVRPASLIYLDAMWRTSDGERVRRVEDDRRWSNINSVIDPPSVSPFYIEYNNTYKIYPNNIGSVDISYYTMPVVAKWAYTIVDGRPVYDPVNSVDPVWSDDVIYKILLRMARAAGIRIKDQDLIAFDRLVNQEGE